MRPSSRKPGRRSARGCLDASMRRIGRRTLVTRAVPRGSTLILPSSRRSIRFARGQMGAPSGRLRRRTRCPVLWPRTAGPTYIGTAERQSRVGPVLYNTPTFCTSHTISYHISAVHPLFRTRTGCSKAFWARYPGLPDRFCPRLPGSHPERRRQGSFPRQSARRRRLDRLAGGARPHPAIALAGANALAGPKRPRRRQCPCLHQSPRRRQCLAGNASPAGANALASAQLGAAKPGAFGGPCWRQR